jgi:hypothetical protein
MDMKQRFGIDEDDCCCICNVVSMKRPTLRQSAYLDNTEELVALDGFRLAYLYSISHGTNMAYSLHMGSQAWQTVAPQSFFSTILDALDNTMHLQYSSII